MKKNLLSTALIALTALFAMPLGVWADDVVVSTATTWTFPQLGTSNITAVTAQQTNDAPNGLYYRATSVVPISFETAGSLTWNFGDGHTFSSSSSIGNARVASANSGFTTPTITSASDNLNSDAGNIDRGSFAFTTGKPGFVYVSFRVEDGATSTYSTLYYKASGGSFEVAAREETSTTNVATNKQGALSYYASNAGTFVFGSVKKYKLYAIEFIPLYSNITATNGSCTISSVTAASTATNGYDVTFSVTPNAGYYLAAAPTVTGSDESSVTVTDNGNGTYTFTTTKFPVTISAPSVAANPIGTWDFQSWASGSNYINGGTSDAAIHYLERNSNDVLTGRIDIGSNTASGSYYTTALPLNGVFGATDTNLKIRHHGTLAYNNGLMVENNNSTSLVIYKLKQGDWMRFNLNNGGTGTITFEDNSDNAKVRKLGSSDVVTNVESDAIYVVQQDCDLGIAFAGNGNKYVYSIEISNTENVSAPIIGTYNNGEVTITNGTTTSSTSTVTTYYTLDGSTPSASHKDGSFTDASKAIQIDQTRIVKAVTISSTEVSSDVVTKKITVDAATPATTWDFVNDETLSPLAFGDALGIKGYYYTTSDANNDNFINITNSPVHSKMSWLVPNVANPSVSDTTGTGLKDNSYRAFAINDLHVGDKIYVTYTGGTMNVSSHSTYGNTVSINATAVTKGSKTAFDSGAAIEVTAIDNTYNYVMLKADAAAAIIQKIEINPVYTITNATDNESGITVAITKENDAETDKTFESTFARGTTVTLAATYSATGKQLVWMDGEDNVLTANNDGTVTITMDGNKTIKATLTIPVWTVNDVTVESYTESTAVDGVQIHGNNTSGHGVSVTDLSPAKTGSFSNTDATAYSVSKYLTIPGAVSASTDEIANKAATMRLTANNTESLKEYLAMDVTEAGTLYVLYRPNSATDGRNVYVGFQKNSDNSYTKTIQSATLGTEYTEIKHSGNGAGTFFVYGSIAMKVYAMMFVPETVKTLTTVANPADGGVINVTNGNATYEGAANGLAIQPYTELTLAATANTGYNFTGWSDNVTSNTITMDDDKTATATFEAVTYLLTITQPATGGSITATVDETSYTESTDVLENKTVTLTAVPAVGYQLTGWTDGTKALGNLPKSLVNTITMDAAKSATAMFEATPAVTGVTEESLWTFDSFDANTILSDTKVYGYNNGTGTLYISGHSASGSLSDAATVATGSMTEGQVVGSGDAIQPERCLSLQGNGISSLSTSREANTFTPDAIAFQAGVPGTVYVLMSGAYKTGDTRTINIAANKSESDNTKKAVYSTTLTEGDAVQVVSCEITEASSVFIGTSGGGKNIYAVKFVPAPTYTVGKATMTNGDVTIDPTTATAGTTVTLTVNPAEGYRLKSGTLKATYNDGSASQELAITDNTFIMPAYAVTVSAEFEAVNPIGTWDFQTWANGSDYINGGANDAAIHYLESNSNGVLTGRIDTGSNTASGSYYTTALPLNGVFGATDTNLKIKHHSTLANNGLIVENGKSSTMKIYNLSEGNSLKVSSVIETGKSGTIQFASGEDYVNLKKYGSDDIATTIESGETYVVQGNGVVGITLSGEGNKYIYSISVSDEILTAPTITLADNVATITAGESSQSGSTLKTYYKNVHSETAPDTPSDANAAATAEWTELSTSSVTVDEPGILYAITYNTTKGTKSDVTSARVIYGTHDFRAWALTDGNLSSTSATDVTWSDGNLTANDHTMYLSDAFTTGTTKVQIRKNNTATSGLVANNGSRDITIQHLTADDRIIIDGCEEGSYTSSGSTTTTYLKVKSTNVKLVKSDGTKADVAVGDKISVGSIYEVTEGNTMVVTMERATYIYSVKISNSDAMPEPAISDLDFTTNKVTISAADQSLGGTARTAIYYGFDANTEPATEYTSEGISITEDCTIYAMAVAGSVKSAIVSKAIETEKVTGLAIGDLSEGAVSITEGTSTAGSTVITYYTLDGSTPTSESTPYSEAITITETRIVKAISISETGVKSDVVTKKIIVDALTPASTWDFVSDNTLNPLTYADETYNGYYINADGQSKSDGKFKYVTNANIHAKLSWQLEGTETANATVGDNGLAISKGGRVFAINDLHVGDKIYITYTNSGTTPLKTSIYENKGCAISVNGGETVSSGNTTEIALGDEIEIMSTPEGYEYLVLMPNTGITIQKIEINPVYQVTKGTVGSNISSLTMTSPTGKDFGDSFARGTEVTLKAETTATGGEFLWTDGDNNVLTPSTSDASELTITLTDNITVNVSYSNAKTWNFSELTAGDITTVTASNGMYYRAGARTTDGKQGRAIVVGENTSQLTWNFPDGTVYSRQNSSANTAPYVTLPGNTTLAPASSAAPSDKEGQTLTSDDDSNNRSLAFTTTSAGTVYVAYRVASGRYANLYFKPTSGDGYSIVSTDGADDNNNRQGMLFYTAPEAGSFFIGGTGDMNVYLVQFEPTSESIFTLTETANPTDGGSVKKEIVYGDTPSYYETPANTFLAGTKLRLTPTPNVGYGFSYWGDSSADTDASKTITMDENKSVTVNFSEVKHSVTVASAVNGTVTLQVGGSPVELTDRTAQIGEGATVTILTMPTLFYGVENITVAKTDDATTTVEVTNGKFTLPDYDVTVTVTFKTENKCDATETKTWTFEEDKVDATITGVKYWRDAMYLRGSTATNKGFTKVDAGSVTSVTLNGEDVAVSKALQTAATFDAPDAGNNSATSISWLKASSGTAMLALNAAVKGTLYVAMSPVNNEEGQARIYFYDGTNAPTEVKAKTAFSSSSEVYTVSYETTVPGIFFVGGTKAVNIYAAKFVPTDTSGDTRITNPEGQTYKLSNGLLSVTIGDEGYVDRIVMADGTEIMKEGGSHDKGWGYFSYNTSSSDSRRLFKDGESYPTVEIKTQTSDMVEIVYTNNNNSLAQTWSVGYIMRKGVSGLYTYAKVKNGSTESDLPEARFVWRPDRDNFNYGYVSDDRQGTDAIPSYDKFSVATELQDATYRFSDNTIYTKYDWANFMKDDQVHGVMSNTNGLWVIQPSTEWVNGGVQKQDLMVHADDGGPVVLQMMQSQHFGAASHTLAANEEKFFGPSLLYLNSGSSKDAMISDAKTMAESEVGAWPYSWFENDDYPQASDRSKVTGTITLSNTDFTTTKIRVILADNSVDDPLVQVGGYQYATDVESTTGSYAFSINNVREGTYALFAYALNGDATGVLKTSRTYTMPTNKGMGTIVWEPKKYGEKLWQIGEADHSTAGFKLSDHARQYGLWEQAPASLTYTVGTSTESDWYYVQPKGSTWTVNFDCDETFTEPLHLTIAVAGASRKPTLVIKMNDHQVYNAQYTSDDPSVYRSATLAGKYGLLEVEIPANNMVTGTNSLTIAANSSSSEVVGLMYDCIKLERPNPKYVVDDVKNWVFGELTTGTVYKAITPVNEEYYLRAGGVVTGTSTATRTFTVTDATDTPTFTFADGSSVSTNTGKYLKANGAYKAGDNPIGATSSAGGNESYSYPMFAFNISESGTVYAKVKGTKNDKFRIYFANGNSITNKEFTATGDIDEITCTASEAGSVFITDVTSAFEIHAVRFVPDSKAVKYELTLGSPENGTITASVGSTSYAGGTTNEVIPVTEVTLTAVPGTGYQLKGWTDGDGNAVGTLPQSIVNTYTMPTASATVTAEFEALPKLEGLTEKTTWLFDGFKAGTILSDSEAYGFNNGTGTLYVSGHSNGSASAMATVKAGDEVSGNLGSIEVKATNYLALAGEVHSDTYVKSDRAANTFTKDAIAFRASRPGTVYALMQGTYSDSETRTFNIYVNGTVNKTEMPSDNAATVVSQEIADTAATVFIAGSRGDYKVYAVRFVPQEDKKVEVVVTKEDDNNATVTSVDIGSDAAEVVIPATAEDGTPVTKIADDVFTEDNTANVSSIDLSETQVTLDGNRSTNDVLKVIPENTLIYVPETSTVTGTNVVKKTGEGDGATYNCENYEVVDGAETTIPHSFTAGTAKLERNFTAGKKCTVCLPYDFEAEGGTFYKFTGISNGKVQMTQQTGLLPKNTPYIFVPESDATETAVAENVEVKINGIPETVNDESNFKFTGTYEHLNWEAPSGIYGFAAEENGLATVGQFVRVGNGAGIEAYRAYLTYTGEGAISGTNAAPRRRASGLPAILEIEWIAASGTTVIREMRQSDEHDAPVYNMSGQRVDGSYKGMVIINGKKVIRK